MARATKGRACTRACIIGLVAILATPTALAVAAHAHGAARYVRLHFKSLGIGSAETDGRYVVLAHGYAGPNIVLKLLDEKTGTERPLPGNAPCVSVGEFAGPWLVGGGCVSTTGALTIPLYSLASGKTRFVTISDLDCKVPGEEQCRSTGAGSDWVGFELTAYHEPTQTGYQSLRNGTIRAAPTLTRTTRLDLNSPTLTSRICPPLREISNASLTFYGRFAVQLVEQRRNTYADYLERCGSKLRIKLSSPTDVPGALRVFGSSGALMWAVGAHLLEGIALPRLTRLEIRTPSTFNDEETSFVLSSKTLYAQDNDQHLWAAPWSAPH